MSISTYVNSGRSATPYKLSTCLCCQLLPFPTVKQCHSTMSSEPREPLWKQVMVQSFNPNVDFFFHPLSSSRRLFDAPDFSIWSLLRMWGTESPFVEPIKNVSRYSSQHQPSWFALLWVKLSQQCHIMINVLFDILFFSLLNTLSIGFKFCKWHKKTLPCSVDFFKLRYKECIKLQRTPQGLK